MGTISAITYIGDDTKSTVTIKVSNGEQTIQYELTVTQKPSVKLTYFDTDGTTILGVSRREKGKTIDQFDVSSDAVKFKKGYKMRGWYHEPDGRLKYTVGETVDTDINLYAFATIIEEASTSAVYNFDLTDTFFDPDNHEAFNPMGEGFGWLCDKYFGIFRMCPSKPKLPGLFCKFSKKH